MAVVLFEALTGMRPFGHGKIDQIDVMHEIRNKPVPRARDVDGGFSQGMDELIFDAMKRDPTERTSAKDMRDSLLQYTALCPRQSFGLKTQRLIWGPKTKMVQWSWVEVWNRQYGPLGYTWANDPESGRRLVEGVYRPPRAEAPLPGTIEVELKGIKSAVDKKTGEVKILGKGETSEDWTLHIKIGDRLRMHGSGVPFDVVVTKISAPKYVGSAAKSKFIFGVLEFEFLDSPPTCDEAAATVAQVVVDCVIPRIPKDTKLDEMVKNRYLSGDVASQQLISHGNILVLVAYSSWQHISYGNIRTGTSRAMCQHGISLQAGKLTMALSPLGRGGIDFFL